MNVAEIAYDYRRIPLGLIDEPELPARSEMDEKALDDLAQSIREIGLQQALVVARVGQRLEVIAGHRRWHACRRAGLVDVDCKVYATKDQALEAVKFAENAYREALNPVDEAIWFAQLLEKDCGDDVDVLAARLRLKRGYVENRLLLLRGCDQVLEALRQGRVKVGVAQQLNRIADRNFRLMYLDSAVRNGATVAAAAGWVSDWQRHAQLNPPSDTPPASSAPTSPVLETNYFRCIVCGRTDHVHAMIPVNIHGHCKLAILDPLLGNASADTVNPEQLGDPRRI